MARVFEPPLLELERLLTPLMDGERRVIDILDKRLPQEWEFYIQPHLNGLRPDLVLLNPKIGVAVFEVKDWNFGDMRYAAVSDPRTNELRLKTRGIDGQLSREIENPVSKILLYKDEIFNLYCPRLENKSGLAAITAGLIFTKATRAQVNQVIQPFRKLNLDIMKYPNYHPLGTIEALNNESIDTIFPEWQRTSSQPMNEDIAMDLRAWLKEPAFSQEQRKPLEMDARQIVLSTTRTESGYRRIKGPAGSGKSVVLAARAAELANEGKTVLILTYNITLLNYLRDLAVRHASSRKIVSKQIDFLHFHGWCKRVCYACGRQRDYHDLWKFSDNNDDESSQDKVLEIKLPQFVQKLYDDPSLKDILPTYDGILVDEGQDFHPIWWQTLRKAVKPGGELILVADKTQNVYATAEAWTEATMNNSGFSGPWNELKISYRLPPTVVPLLELFIKEFLKEEEVDIPELEMRQQQLEFEELFPAELRWIQLQSSDSPIDHCVREILHQMTRLRRDTAIPDITFLCANNTGRAVVEKLNERKIYPVHTFDLNKNIARRQKRAFFQGSANIKATTLHSFKGWEARHLVVFVGRAVRREDLALIYTALTRLRRHEHGSVLTVVCSCPELEEFGRSWPEFVRAEMPDQI